VLARLLGKADVFVQNVAPGASRRLGTSAAELRARYPTLVICNVSGYGSSGPYADKKAYDLLIQSEVGLISITGTPESPSKVGISVADMAAGTYAYSGILAALLARSGSGKGTAIEVSLFDALGEWMGPAAYYTMYGGASLPRSGPNHASITPYGPYASREGGPVSLAIQHAREWARFCADVLGQPALADDERFRTNAVRVKHRAQLDDAINRVFSTLTAQEILDRLDAAGIASARMNSVAEFVRHPQLSGRNRWREIGSPAGALLAPMPPVHMEDVEPVMGAVPALGQQTDGILEELGFSRDRIDQWRREGTI
jgi:itaconate CoA-transferase